MDVQHWSERYPSLWQDFDFTHTTETAQRLFVMMLEWSRVHDTDGFIPDGILLRLANVPDSPTDGDLLAIVA